MLALTTYTLDKYRLVGRLLMNDLPSLVSSSCFWDVTVGVLELVAANLEDANVGARFRVRFVHFGESSVPGMFFVHFGTAVESNWRKEMYLRVETKIHLNIVRCFSSILGL